MRKFKMPVSDSGYIMDQFCITVHITESDKNAVSSSDLPTQKRKIHPSHTTFRVSMLDVRGFVTQYRPLDIHKDVSRCIKSRFIIRIR